MQSIPPPFRERYDSIVSDKFYEYLEKPLPRSFRINNLKANKKEVLERFESYGIELKPVTWYSDAFISDSRIGNTIEHFMGWIYVQELTSMLPPLIMSKELGRTILDAAAAPGSKTTQLADLMENKGLIVANDISYLRTKALKSNLEKLGVINTVVTNYNLKNFPKVKFDAILLDAPCSSEGTIRKNPDILSIWSIKDIIGKSRLQKDLILKAYDLLKEGGYLIYSTCTFAPEENEEVVNHLLENREVRIEKINLDLKNSPGLDSWQKRDFSPEVKNCCRIWPEQNDTGGFFLCKIRRP